MTRTSAMWLVQARNTGEPWKTLSRHLTRADAQAAADTAAAKRTRYAFTGRAIPDWTYVRLSYRGSHVDLPGYVA